MPTPIQTAITKISASLAEVVWFLVLGVVATAGVSAVFVGASCSSSSSNDDDDSSEGSSADDDADGDDDDSGDDDADDDVDVPFSTSHCEDGIAFMIDECEIVVSIDIGKPENCPIGKENGTEWCLAGQTSLLCLAFCYDEHMPDCDAAYECWTENGCTTTWDDYATVTDCG